MQASSPPGARTVRERAGVLAPLRARPMWKEPVLFWALCCYLLAQAYMIPILPLGPWPIWPTLGDLAAACLLGALLLAHRQLPPLTAANRRLCQLLVVALIGWIASFAYLVATNRDSRESILNGGFELLRLIEFTCIFVAVARVPLTAGRVAILRRVTDGVIAFITACLGLIHFGILPLSALTKQLPQSPGVAGPWSDYARLAKLGITNNGLSTVGYNHAYVAALLLALAALRIHLAGASRERSNACILLLAMVGCFLSGSRAGLLGILIFAAAYWLHRPRQLAVIGVVGVVLWLVLATFGVALVDRSLAETIARQKELLAANDPENMGGRVQIWQRKADYLSAQPVRWLIGGGLGVITTPGQMQNAHLMYLQIVVDTGLVGLAAYALLVATALVSLWRRASRPRAIFWATVALLVSSLTQETFYPVASQGHFLGLYLCCLALTLGQAREPVPAQTPAVTPEPTAGGIRDHSSPLAVAYEE